VRIVLEGVSCRELNGTRPAACIRNLPEVGVRDVVVGVAVTGEVEHIEAIHPQANDVLFGYVEILKQGAIDLFESGRALRTIGPRAIRYFSYFMVLL
jgi:hypothetical protein